MLYGNMVGWKMTREREERIIRACNIANGDADGLAIEREWEALVDDKDRIDEPWHDAPER